MKKLTRALAFGLAALLPLSAALAQDIKERTFKFALQNPKGHPLEQGATKFSELVAAKSGGKIKVNVFPGGTLGGDAANVSALQGGTIEFVMLNSGILASQVKDFEVYDFPLMFWRDVRNMEERISTARTFRVILGEGVHSAQVAGLIQRLSAIGYRGDYSFEVFNDG
jgi:TRAP-type C4-dicarboxylate transport system substrate-binding protein